MTNRKILSLLIVSIMISNIAIASSTSPFQFLRYHGSARSAALAGCMVSMTGDPSALFYNPATIATVDEKHFAVTFLKHVLDINSGNVSYIRNFEGLGTFAGSVVYTNYGSFDAADQFGNINGTFGANDLAFQGTYANKLDSNLYWGATLKLLYINIENESSLGFAVDAGILYLLPDGRTNIGASVLHVGSQIVAYNDIFESLPLDIRLGVNHRLEGLPLLVNLTFHHLADQTDAFFDKFSNFAVAGELYLGENLQVRLGYDNQIRTKTTPSSDKGFSGLSAGVGYKAELFDIDYGLAQYGGSAILHRFSVRLDL
jgi:hypothetical protein